MQATDGCGTLLPETEAVLKLAARYGLIVAIGHLSAEEGLCIVREGKRLGIQQMILTHVEHPALHYSDEQQQEAAALGVYVEHSYNNAWFGRYTIGEIARQIRAVGCEHVILTTDFGQAETPFCDEGIKEYATQLQTLGFSPNELRTMLCENPTAVISGQR